MLKKSLAFVVLMGLLMPSVPLRASEIPIGTKVIVKTLQTISSASNQKGDLVSMTVVADVLIDGKKVIATGAPAVGIVLNASKRFIAGIGGQLDIQVQKVQAVDGSWVPVDYKKGEHNGSNLISVICTVVCCIVFIFIPGKNVSIDQGTLFETVVTAPSTVGAAK